MRDADKRLSDLLERARQDVGVANSAGAAVVDTKEGLKTRYRAGVSWGEGKTLRITELLDGRPERDRFTNPAKEELDYRTERLSEHQDGSWHGARTERRHNGWIRETKLGLISEEAINKLINKLEPLRWQKETEAPLLEESVTKES
jgi:hypothetical protein